MSPFLCQEIVDTHDFQVTDDKCGISYDEIIEEPQVLSHILQHGHLQLVVYLAGL